MRIMIHTRWTSSNDESIDRILRRCARMSSSNLCSSRRFLDLFNDSHGTFRRIQGSLEGNRFEPANWVVSPLFIQKETQWALIGSGSYETDIEFKVEWLFCSV